MNNKVRKKTMRIPTAESLANAALYYLSRYAASEASLRRVLLNKMRRAALYNPSFASDEGTQRCLQEVIENLIAKHKKLGVINDTAFADMKVSSLRRQGLSARAIKQKLTHKGVPETTIIKALQENNNEEDERSADLKAAHMWAKKKRLGQYRQSMVSAQRYRKDLAALARAGFSHDVAREVLGEAVYKDLTEDE